MTDTLLYFVRSTAPVVIPILTLCALAGITGLWLSVRHWRKQYHAMRRKWALCHDEKEAWKIACHSWMARAESLDVCQATYGRN